MLLVPADANITRSHETNLGEFDQLVNYLLLRNGESYSPQIEDQAFSSTHFKAIGEAK